MENNEKCLICRKSTYGSIFCSLSHYNQYSSNKKRYKNFKVIKENLQTVKDIRIDNLLKGAETHREKNIKINNGTSKQPSFWEHLKLTEEHTVKWS